MKKEGMGWGWIIFWVIIFWPVGLFLASKKMLTSRSTLMSGKTGAVSVFGWFLVAVGAMAFMLGFPYGSHHGEGIFLFISLVMIVGGASVLRKVSKTKRTAARYKKYIDLVVNQNVRYIDNIAASIEVSYDAAIKDLQDMIDIGCFEDAYIDYGIYEIVLKQAEPVSYTEASTDSRADAQKIAVRCSGCGANNVVVVGSVSECEYCGRPISV